jgi:hypothetical protein
MIAAVILVSVSACVFGFFYLLFTTRNRERMAMIEKGADPALFSTGREPRSPRVKTRGSGLKFTLKSGMLIIGIGIGFVISVLFNGLIDRGVYPLLVIGIIFICGGSGLVAGFYMGRNLEKKEVVE